MFKSKSSQLAAAVAVFISSTLLTACFGGGDGVTVTVNSVSDGSSADSIDSFVDLANDNGAGPFAQYAGNWRSCKSAPPGDMETIWSLNSHGNAIQIIKIYDSDQKTCTGNVIVELEQRGTLSMSDDAVFFNGHDGDYDSEAVSNAQTVDYLVSESYATGHNETGMALINDLGLSGSMDEAIPVTVEVRGAGLVPAGHTYYTIFSHTSTGVYFSGTEGEYQGFSSDKRAYWLGTGIFTAQ